MICGFADQKKRGIIEKSDFVMPMDNLTQWLHVDVKIAIENRQI